MIQAFFGVQLIALFFGLFMLYLIFLHHKRGNIDQKEYYIWLVLWSGFLFFTIFPTLLNPFLSDLNVIRVFDLLTIGAFMVLTYLGFQNHVGVKDLQRRIQKMVSERAIKDEIKKRK